VNENITGIEAISDSISAAAIGVAERLPL